MLSLRLGVEAGREGLNKQNKLQLLETRNKYFCTEIRLNPVCAQDNRSTINAFPLKPLPPFRGLQKYYGGSASIVDLRPFLCIDLRVCTGISNQITNKDWTI
ncbi:hypothetical protein CEXT_755561 [Caerostris extrusa]|uniref:Uncharacterized protein n=1 Tax=Caerostris extrusa TaxID=172846 RepID=A0AAV4PFF9_CAEEX|nr:hypothetical protein CEXT_755561 [Caerostris extrusa]